MIKFLERSSNSISISNFHEEYSLNKYNMNPPYQRRSVWSVEKKAFFIDSILKNLPIPPVFLRQKVDDETGKTSYEVIDGKQRLTSLVEFIEDEFSTADEGEDPFHDAALAGKYFSELSSVELDKYKKKFWRYQIPVEYIDTEDPVVIDKIFDRLNRNGEPLTGQELRHSNYYASGLLKLCYKLANLPFWKERLETTDKARMEDVEFISELVFAVIEGKELQATDSDLDGYYSKHADKKPEEWNKIEENFLNVTNVMESIAVNYAEHKVYGVSHLYGIWCFSMSVQETPKVIGAYKKKIDIFYKLLRSRDYSNQCVRDYKDSMSNRTRYAGQRRKRKEALLQYLKTAKTTKKKVAIGKVLGKKVRK